MRRKDREITDRGEIKGILDRGTVCHIAFGGGEWPYVVPVNYGCCFSEMPVLYFHGAAEGKKLELMGENPKVAFCVSRPLDLVTGEQACSYAMHFESVMGYGTLSLVTDEEEKKSALDSLMAHYGFEGKPQYAPETLGRTAVLKLTVTEISAKKR